MNAADLGEAAAHIPWLSPGTDSLTALVRQPVAEAWGMLRADPGCLLLLLCHSSAAATSTADFRYPPLLHEPTIFDAAIRHLAESGRGFVSWTEPAAARLRAAALSYARTAARLAERSGTCAAEHAWVAGMLAPLGWYAIAALTSDAVTACLDDPAFDNHPREVQQRLWGLTAQAIARRLARRWRLPRWLGAVVGHLDLPTATACNLGADPALFEIVQAAVFLAQRQGTPKLLPAPVSEDAPLLDLADGTYAQEPEPVLGDVRDPRGVPLLTDLLRLAADNRRLQNAPILLALEQDTDRLQEAIHEQRAGEAERVQGQKLRALAEFAAGAGHEINNPLAVISGQAQYLLNRETEPTRQKSLQKIVGQAQRVHQILQELMQFARPARAQKEPLDLNHLAQEATLGLAELATQRNVQLHCIVAHGPVLVDVDPRQIRTALVCLVRNAIQAAPCEGWATVQVDDSNSRYVNVFVEDNGSGPGSSQREHLFDPFYSGRPAGRGRGLGLPTAWRLAGENGGSVRYEPTPGGPTRFVLTLPRGVPAPPLSVAS